MSGSAMAGAGVARGARRIDVMGDVVREASVPMALLDRELRFLAASERWTRLYGGGRADLTGLALYDVLPSVPGPWRQAHLRGLAGEHVREREDSFVFGDGERRWFDWSVGPWRDEAGAVAGIVMTADDVTDRKRAELALRHSEARYHALVDASPDGIVVHVDQRIVYANAAALELFGARAASDLVGRPIYDLVAPAHHAIAQARQEAHARNERVPPVVFTTRPLSGPEREVEVSAIPTTFDGRPAVYGVLRDVTERRRLVREREESEARFTELAASIDQVFAVTSADGSQVHYLSPAFETVFGLAREDAMADRARWSALVHPDDRLAPGDAANAHDREYRILRPDGALRWLRARVRPITDAEGTTVRLAAVIEDVTDRKAADVALRESEERYRRLVEDSPYGVFVHVGRRFVFGNAAAARLFGVREGSDLVGRAIWDFLHPSFHAQTEERLVRLDRGEQVGALLLTRIRTTSGELRDAEVTPTPIRFHGQNAVLAIMRDVTDERLTARAVREHEARLAGIVSSAMDAIISTDESLGIVLTNPAAERMFGYGPGELLGKRIDVLLPPRVRVRHAEAMRRFAASGVPQRQMLGATMVGLHRDGTEIPIEASIAKTEVDGKTLFTVMHRDLRPRLAAERAARDTEERFLELAENVDVVFAVVSPDRSAVLYLSPAFDRVFGLRRADVLAGTARWTDVVHPDDRPTLERMRVAEAYDLEYRIVRPDGAVRWLNGRVRPVRDAEGRVVRYVGIIADITERRALEGQLEQSQKLESIGRLAGGLAHDFNNLLTVVTSASELLHDEPLSEVATSLLGEIDDVGRRGAALTRQLLSFSRQDILEPTVVELGGLVEEALRLLRRLIGENVQLKHTRRDAVRVRVDAGQWDQVLVNLVVNARDAMPRGGTLRVETGSIVIRGDARFPDAPPGEYALLRVADSGEGMSPEVRARIFEPFFTTKPRQQGTGLGLAVVYGIVKQAGGHIHVDSELGRGTTFSILVPISERPVDAPSSASARRRALAGGPEAILVVEDDDAVRRVASRCLAQTGYEVLSAQDGEAALAILERRSVDLVLTDVVMPKLDGPSLVRAILARWPRTKVLLSTGYVDGSLDVRELADHPVLRKPYSQQKLLEKVREVLRG